MICVIVIDRLLAGGVKFVLDKLAVSVDAELHDPSRIREELLEVQLRYELGEISDEDRDREEARLLRELRDAGEERSGPISFESSEGPEVEVSFRGSGDE